MNKQELVKIPEFFDDIILYIQTSETPQGKYKNK